MHYVSLIVEFLRGRPAVVFWVAALSQAVLWVIFPWLFFSSPPGDVPVLLAVGHELRLGSYLGPPLAAWFGDLAFRIAGEFGVYVLAQVCVVAAFWAVFDLGRMIVGTRHAALAVLLMTGIAAFNLPTAGFGPSVLAMPLWALALNYYWRAIGDDGRGYWYLLALALGLLLLTTYAGVILLVLLLVYSLAIQRGRQAFTEAEPWLAAVLLIIVVFPHGIWLAQNWPAVLSALRESYAGEWWTSPAARFASLVVVAHFGLVLLAVLASGWRATRNERVPEIDRNPAARSARIFIYVFALAPALLVLALLAVFGRIEPLERAAPFILLSGLLVMTLAGDRVLIYRERIVSFSWLGLLVAPPLLAVVSLLLLPWVSASNLQAAQPAATMGRFFADNFQRRTGRPLRIVAGDEQLATMIALAARSRPTVYFNNAPERSPWVDAELIRQNGAVLVWPATETNSAPPAALRAQFPEMSPEVPRAFARSIQGRLPLIRVGWAMIRPQVQQTQ
ncbi:MAG: glycosyltransferase family 39 protein [Pseudolabrys sp.]